MRSREIIRNKALAIPAALALIAVLLSSCSQKSTSDPKRTSPENTMKRILELESFGQLDKMYEYLHPDLQERVNREDFMNSKKKLLETATIVSFEVGKPEILESWTFSSGVFVRTYKKVAAIPVTITIRAPIVGDQVIKDIDHLAKAEDGTWRFFWTKPKEKTSP